jgi:hypothetical protein
MDAGAKPVNSLESNKIMNLEEMVELVSPFSSFIIAVRSTFIFQFDITAITQRNTILEARNLHYINKHHLMRRMKEQGQLFELAMRIEKQVKERFPERFVPFVMPKKSNQHPLISPHTTPETIMRVILLLEVSPHRHYV